MTLTQEADRHHLLGAVLEKVCKVAGHLGTAGSACPHVPLSVKTWRHQPSTSQTPTPQSATLSRISVFLMGGGTLNAFAYRLHMVHWHCLLAASLAQAA